MSDDARVEAVARAMFQEVVRARLGAPDFRPGRAWETLDDQQHAVYLALARWHLAEVEKERLFAEADARAAHHFANNRCREKDSALAELAAAREDIRALAAALWGWVGDHACETIDCQCSLCAASTLALARPGVKAAEGRT